MKLSSAFVLVAGILTTPVAAMIPLAFVADDPAIPLGECEADCDTDADCEAGLVCYHRQAGFNEPIPVGCAASGVEADGDLDFCYDREGNFPHTAQHFGTANHMLQQRSTYVKQIATPIWNVQKVLHVCNEDH